MTTNERIEAARLTDEELLALPHNGPYISPRMVADAATAKALRVEDARHQALVEALRRVSVWAKKYPWTGLGDANGHKEGIGLMRDIRAALKLEEEANDREA